MDWYDLAMQDEEEEAEKNKVKKNMSFADKVRVGINSKPKINKIIKKKKCDTCNPRKHMKKHTIETINGIKFHHDMCYRSLIIVTPDEHFTKIKEKDSEYIGKMFKTISEFCNDWGLDKYTVMWDFKETGNDHFKIKIKASDDKITRIRDTHFKVIKMEKIRNPY